MGFACRAQEEDLCRLLPQLHPALTAAAAAGGYPIPPDAALLARGLAAVRLGLYPIVTLQYGSATLYQVS